MTDMFNKTYNDLPKVKRIFQKEKGDDGFSVELEDEKILDISKSQWCTPEKWRKLENECMKFDYMKGRDRMDIVFSKEKLEEAERLLGQAGGYCLSGLNL